MASPPTCCCNYRIAQPSEILIIAGECIGANDMKVKRSGCIWPFQTYRRVNVSPKTYGLEIETLTKDKQPCILKVWVTVGPTIKEGNKKVIKMTTSLRNYMKFFSDQSRNQQELLLQMCLQTQCQVFIASRSLADVCRTSEDEFKTNIYDVVEAKLGDFGLVIHYHSTVPTDMRLQHQYEEYGDDHAEECAKTSTS